MITLNRIYEVFPVSYMPDERILSIPLVIRVKVPGENYFITVPVTDQKLAEKMYRGRATVRDIINYLDATRDILPENDKVKLETVLQILNDWEISNTNWQAVIVSEEGGRVIGELASYTPDSSIPEVHIIRKRTEDGLEVNSLDIVFKPIERGGAKVVSFFMTL